MVRLCQRTLRFLGHVVSVDGISPDPEKVQAIRDWPRPQTTKDVRSFLGLCNYYMEFIPDMQLMAKPLNELTGKGKFEWTTEREEAFCRLKDALTRAPVLAFPDLSQPFELSTGASDTGFGCILAQRDRHGKERPVHYISKTFSNNELAWHTRDKEAFALVYALRKFRHYLLGRKFTWYTDHLGLRWLRNTRDPRGRYARWIEEIEEFEFDTCYRAGRHNQHADALSRRPEVCCAAAVLSAVRFSVEDIRKQQAADPVLGKIIQHLRLGDKCKTRQVPSNPGVKSWINRKDSLFIDSQGVLYIKFRRGRKLVSQLVVPESLVPDVLRLKHDEAGHMSAIKTKKLVLREYYWLSMNADVSKYCQTCFTCARCKDPPKGHTTDSTTTSQPREPWQEISLDLKDPFGSQPTGRGNRYLLVVVDLFTRAAEMIPIHDKTAKTVANALVRDVFCRHGLPKSILTDKGLEFDNSAMLVLAKELGLDKKRISALHPQANGAVERLNRTIGQMLKKELDDGNREWDLKVPFVRFNYTNQVHSSTGYSPFFMLHGRHPRTPVLVEASTLPKPASPQQWASELARTLKDAYSTGAAHDIQSKEKRCEEGKQATQTFNIGDEVLIFSPKKSGHVKSLHKAWTGPFTVIQRREGNTYRVKNANNFRQRFIRHCDQLRPIHKRPVRLCNKSEGTQPQDDSTQRTDTPTQTSEPLTFDAELDQDSENEDPEEIVHERNATQQPAEQEGPRRSHRHRREPRRYGQWVDPLVVAPLYSDIVKRRL